MTTIKTAIIQFTSGPSINDNINAIAAMICEAADSGARLVVTPENTCHIRERMTDKLESAPIAENHPALPFFAELARRLGIYLLIGSISVRLDGGKLANRSYLFMPDDRAPITYDKIHLFDAEFDGGKCYRESDVFANGSRAIIADIDGIKMGLTICYDLRFPGLYRALAQRGAQVIAAPAAFATETGSAHWHTLVRARAIENGVYMLAPGQAGMHEGGRTTYGHSLIVDPWGTVIQEGDDKTAQILYADIHAGEIARVRQSLRSLTHDRDFEVAALAECG